jgi:hypothetical protein
MLIRVLPLNRSLWFDAFSQTTIDCTMQHYNETVVYDECIANAPSTLKPFVIEKKY